MADAAPVVGGEDENGVVKVPALLQGVHHLPDGLVHGGQHAQHQHPLLAHFLIFQTPHIFNGHLVSQKLGGNRRVDHLHGGVESLEREIEEKRILGFRVNLFSLLYDPHRFVSIEVSAVPEREIFFWSEIEMFPPAARIEQNLFIFVKVVTLVFVSHVGEVVEHSEVRSVKCVESTPE